MVSLELRFVQERGEDGQLVYRLEPYVNRLCSRELPSDLRHSWYRPLDVFITYDGKRASDISISRYAVRHIVAAEARHTHCPLCFPELTN